jgi:signal transduction histidine kinase
MKTWSLSPKLLIPSKFLNDPVDYRKALVLVWSHLFMLVGVFFTYVLASAVSIKLDLPMPLWFLFLFILSSIYIFHRWQNLIISGNYVSLGCFAFLVEQIPYTGGMFSDNIVWLIVVPFLSFLIMGFSWAFPWIILVFFTFIGCFFYGGIHPEFNKLIQNDGYYFGSYSGVVFIVFGFLYIFERSQSLVLNELRIKNQEISDQAEALKLKDIKLQKSNHDLQNFAYSASHDLKEPLRMIGMYNQLLQKRTKGTLDERSEEYMYYMTDGVKRMGKLLDDLLTYSRLGKNEHDLVQVNLNETLLMVTQNLTVVIQESNTLVTSAPLPTIKASPTEMMQLFQNIIANAIKFRRQGVIPRISLEYVEQESTHQISIADNGIGIKAEFQEKVFELFTKLHSMSEYEGSGIGLATCKKIVEELNGQMWLTSTEGVGTTFHFSFPKQSKEVMAPRVEQLELVAA